MVVIPRACGIMFHHFSDKTHRHGQGVWSRLRFANFLDRMGKRIVGADKWDYLATSRKLTNQVCLTFDDGLMSQFDIAREELAARGLSAFFFINTAPLVNRVERMEVYRKFRTSNFDSVDNFYSQFLERVSKLNLWESISERVKASKKYLSNHSFYSENDRIFRYVRDNVLCPEQYYEIMDKWIKAEVGSLDEFAKNLWMNGENIKTLHNDGHVIGMHSHTHPTSLFGFHQEAEYYANREILRGLTGKNPTAVAYPCNLYNDVITSMVMDDLGVSLGFRSSYDYNGRNMLEMPRKDSADL